MIAAANLAFYKPQSRWGSNTLIHTRTEHVHMVLQQTLKTMQHYLADKYERRWVKSKVRFSVWNN